MRKGRTLLLLGLALVMAVGAAWVANNWLAQRMVPTAVAEDTVPVVVAATNIDFGQKIRPINVTVIQIPAKSVTAQVFNKTSEVVNKVATQKFYKGEMLLKERLADYGGGSALAATIKPHMRAVTVRVNDIIGVAGFLLPGNRVDVINARHYGGRTVTHIVLQDLKVLAVDQTASTSKDKPVIVRAVTLEMTPDQANTLVKATHDGTVQLTLRNPMDNTLVKTGETVVSHKHRVHRVRLPSVVVIRGTSVKRDRTRF